MRVLRRQEGKSYKTIGVGFCVARSTTSGNARSLRAWNGWRVQTSTLFCISAANHKSFSFADAGRSIGTLNLHVMEKKNRKEELQSRREFFKKAAKGALPILGAIVLSGAPGIAKAVSHESYVETGCDWGCSQSCYYGCDGSCKGFCRQSCYSACRDSCDSSCRGTCSNSCQGSCSNGCRGGSNFF